ncbi:hypothetical protein ABTX81_17850 [Kitasatospora sp. NPDC097605]|uniref:hypothetical protein n=1 Tax=Kitasatospora sp. NPDC097605 TaxID=3157226 RepID=UPI003333A0CD
MTTTASHSATPPHGRPAHGTARAASAAAVAPADLAGLVDLAASAAAGEGRLPVGPAVSDGSGVPGAPAGPWSVRCVPGGRGRRAALEVYEHGELVDVLVEARLDRGLLRGARAWAGAGAGGRRRPRHGLAWGRLPHGGGVPAVGFTGGRLLRLPGRPAPVVAAGEVVTVAGEFWLAWAEGVFDGVLVEAAGGAGCERSPLTRVRTARTTHAVRTVAPGTGGAR